MNCWKKLLINTDIFIIRFSLKKTKNTFESFTCWLSDFKSIWKETIDDVSYFMDRVQNENKLLDIIEIIDTIYESLISLPDECQNDSEVDEAIKLHIKYYLSKIVPLKFFWQLNKCDQEEFFTEITLSMLRQINGLEIVNSDLKEIIYAKDREINEYKLAGAAPLIRKQLITQPGYVETDLSKLKCFETTAKEFIDYFKENNNENLMNMDPNDHLPTSSTNKNLKKGFSSKNVTQQQQRKHKNFFDDKKIINLQYEEENSEEIICESNSNFRSAEKSNDSTENSIEKLVQSDKDNSKNVKKFRKKINL